ncbi:MAG: DNA repair protein RecN [Myxococcales bacterium]|nr:DNA repair protein RecN [Myxococcales bacterium]
MLVELKIRDLAIIEAMDIRFHNGLNVLTGETGAGKSMILAALGLVLGGRSDRDLIRTGSKEAWVEAIFEVDPSLHPLLKEAGIELDPEDPLILRRVVYQSGRSRAYVNCISASVNLLRQLAPRLLDYGRQHDQTALMSSEQQLLLLDRYAQSTELREAVEAAHAQLSTWQREHRGLLAQRATRAERMDFLNFQRDAIRDVDPQPGEEDALHQELKHLQNAEKRKSLAQKAASMLYGGETSLCAQLSIAQRAVESLAMLDNEEVEDLAEELEKAHVILEEVGRSLQHYGRHQDDDPERTEEIQERLDELIRLQERYGGAWDAVMQRLQDIEDELKSLRSEEERIKELERQIQQGKQTLLQAAIPLSLRRREAARSLMSQVAEELKGLAMPNARLEVRFFSIGSEGVACPWPEQVPQEQRSLLTRYNELDASETSTSTTSSNEEIELIESQESRLWWISSTGAERASFYLSANTGEELRPLGRVASGGELSRILLALKRVLADASEISTFVFDEIDAGMSGSAASLVAQKLRAIVEDPKQSAQILCISHTAQIAAAADAHFVVRKQVHEGRTRSSMIQLDHSGRMKEIARMLTGDNAMDGALELARELLGMDKTPILLRAS